MSLSATVLGVPLREGTGDAFSVVRIDGCRHLRDFGQLVRLILFFSERAMRSASVRNWDV
jgi:hypothetical protein